MHWEIEQSLPLEEEVQDSIVVTHLPQVLEVLGHFVIHHGDTEAEMVMDVPQVLQEDVLVVLPLLMEQVAQEVDYLAVEEQQAPEVEFLDKQVP